ncbi:MAG: chromosomal replication initiator protein DnaA [Alphaproteobacteria bacterium]|nr:chromosomal replication initiator protein DnaA [Alphaproteobacteria bacterium]
MNLSQLRAEQGSETVDRDGAWARVRGQLRKEAGETVFQQWLKGLTLERVDGDLAVFSVPGKFMREWIDTNYADLLRSCWRHETGGAVTDVRIDVGDPSARKSDGAGDVQSGSHSGSHSGSLSDTGDSVATPKSVRGSGFSESGDDLCANLDTRLGFDNFVVGKPNEFAFAAARRVSESTEVTFNPLFLYGGVGLGKTHLMHAIALDIRRRQPERKVVYMSAEKFMYHFIRALRFKDTVAFKERFRNVDVLMIDDVQFISGKESTQEEFFHTFNTLVDSNRQVVVSADKSPHDLEGMEERLRSRLGWGLVADIHPTTYELRLGILQSKVDKMGADVPEKVQEFLAHKITQNVRALEGALHRLVAHAELVGRPVTLESTQEILGDLLRASDRRVTIEEIQKRVAEHFNIRMSDMASARRSRSVARPRQIAMYLSKQLTSRSLPDIGRRFGGRDHTTVMHAVKKVEELRASDVSFAEDVDILRRMLES